MIEEDTMYLVVDVDWAKAHPRKAAKIQVEYLVRMARSKGKTVCAGKASTARQVLRRQAGAD
jgi:hypothetical protein